MVKRAAAYDDSDLCGETRARAKQACVERSTTARRAQPLRWLHRAGALGSTLCIVILYASRTFAQDVQHFHPALNDQGFLGVNGSRTPGSWRGSVHLFSDVSFHPVELRTVDGQVVPIATRVMAHVGGELGLGGRAAIAMRIPLIAYQEGPFRNRDAQVFTWTDPQLWLRYRLIGADMDDDDEPHDGPGVTLQAGTGLPLGAATALKFASDERVRAELSLLGDFQLLGAGAALSLGYRRHFWDPVALRAATFDNARARDEFVFGVAIKVPVPPVPLLAGVIELRGATGFQRAADTVLELDVGARWQLASFTLVVGGGPGLTRGVGSPDGRVFVGAYFTPPQTDADKDGVDDGDDQCPYLAEDRDGHKDDDGCPDPDNDGDLIPDLDDRCPTEAAEEGKDDDEDGCTDTH